MVNYECPALIRELRYKHDKKDNGTAKRNAAL